MAGWLGLPSRRRAISRHRQAITGLRKALGTQPHGVPYIETAVRRGYRFVAPVERAQARTRTVALDAVLHPHRAFIDGRAALETLDRDAVVRARDAFEQALGASPALASAHIGIANASVMLFESARFDGARDPAILRQAEHHAHEACRLAMTAVSPTADVPALPAGSDPLDAAIMNAAAIALGGNPTEAARVCADAIAHAGPGCAGWVLPIDPLLQPTSHGDGWAQVLAMLRDRAT